MNDTIQLPPLTETCGKCEGSGYVYSEAWKRFRDAHPTADDFDAAIKRNEFPQEPEDSVCTRCRGTGEVLTEAGDQIVKALRIAGVVK